MGQDVVDVKCIAEECDMDAFRPMNVGAERVSARAWRPFLAWTFCAAWLGMSAAGCHLTNPNSPPRLASQPGDFTQPASRSKPQTTEPLAPSREISAAQLSKPQLSQIGFNQVGNTNQNSSVPIVRGQSPQYPPTTAPGYPPPTLQDPNGQNSTSAGGGNSYRAPMQATEAGQQASSSPPNSSQPNRYAQATVPGIPGQPLGPSTVGALPGPPNTTNFQSSPPTAVYQPQLPPPAAYGSSPYNNAPYSGPVAPPLYGQPSPSDYGATIAPGATQGPGTGGNMIAPGVVPYTGSGLMDDPTVGINVPGVVAPGFDGYRPRQRIAPIDVYVQEARTGRIIVGGSVNSDLGVAGQIVVDERNFNIRRLPRSWDDLWSGRAFRGGGQNFRLELMPGSQVERYTVSWTERNLFGYLPYSLSVGGFYFTRQYRDWTEQRLGGRVALGYEVTKDLAISGELRMEDVNIFNPRSDGVEELDSALGSNDIYTARLRVTHDTRDSPFLPTRGGLLEVDFDQVFGEYDFSRGGVNYSRYFLVRERPDGTGRHTIATSLRVGITGSQTPIFENYFAGGYSTLRGFSFRGASPVVNDVQVGGEFQLLGSLEYMMPLTADEMLRGVAFVDYGTTEENIEINSENFRVAPGLGLRISVPALGPAPLAFDFAAPLNYADTDDRQVLSFFMGFTR